MILPKILKKWNNFSAFFIFIFLIEVYLLNRFLCMLICQSENVGTMEYAKYLRRGCRYRDVYIIFSYKATPFWYVG